MGILKYFLTHAERLIELDKCQTEISLKIARWGWNWSQRRERDDTISPLNIHRSNCHAATNANATIIFVRHDTMTQCPWTTSIYILNCKESEADYKLRITRGLISYFTGTLTFPRGMCAYLPALRARWPDHPASPRYKCDRQRRCRYCVAALPTCDNMRCWTGSIVRRNTDDAGHNSPLLCVVTVYCPVMLLRRAEETLTVMCMGRVLSLRQ